MSRRQPAARAKRQLARVDYAQLLGSHIIDRKTRLACTGCWIQQDVAVSRKFTIAVQTSSSMRPAYQNSVGLIADE